MCTFGVLWLSCEAPATTREPKRAHLRVLEFKNHQNSTRRPPRERRKERKLWRESEKRAKFWAVQGKRSWEGRFSGRAVPGRAVRGTEHGQTKTLKPTPTPHSTHTHTHKHTNTQTHKHTHHTPHTTHNTTSQIRFGQSRFGQSRFGQSRFGQSRFWPKSAIPLKHQRWPKSVWPNSFAQKGWPKSVWPKSAMTGSLPFFSIFLFFNDCGKNMLQWWRPETNDGWGTTCRHTMSVATKVWCTNCSRQVYHWVVEQHVACRA